MCINKLLITLLFSVLLASSSFAMDFLEHEDFAAGVGLKYESLHHKRGIITYEGYQLLPAFYAQLWHPNLLLVGKGLFYKHNVFNKQTYLRYSIKLGSTKDKPLYYTTEKQDDRVRRESTSEFNLYLERNFTYKAFVRLQLSQDLLAHGGHYIEVYSRLGLYDFKVSGDKQLPLIQPALFAAMGYGNRTHNEYLYGVGAASGGISNIRYGIDISSPQKSDVFWPVIRLSRFELIGDKNKSASYVNETSGWHIEASMVFKVF